MSDRICLSFVLQLKLELKVQSPRMPHAYMREFYYTKRYLRWRENCRFQLVQDFATTTMVGWIVQHRAQVVTGSRQVFSLREVGSQGQKICSGWEPTAPLRSCPKSSILFENMPCSWKRAATLENHGIYHNITLFMCIYIYTLADVEIKHDQAWSNP